MRLCTKETDKFLKEKTIWVAELSDGAIVYQDDGRPGLDQPSAWLRMKDYVDENNLYIENLSIKFRSHVEKIRSGEFYHFSKAIACMVGESYEDYFIFSSLNSGKLTRVWYMIPHILVTNKTITKKLEQYKPNMIKGRPNG